MHFPDYFSPLPVELTLHFNSATIDSLWNATDKYVEENKFPFLNEVQIAIIGVNETRGAEPTYPGSDASDKIRKKFYELKKHSSKTKMVDLGNLKPGHTVADTYSALSDIIANLIDLKVIPVIIGGSQDLTFAHYKAHKLADQVINIACVDACFDLGIPSDPLNSKTWLGHIILDQPNFLFNYSHIGYQTFFVGQHAVDMMNNLYFDTYRLGQIKSDIKEIEPVVRNADVLTVDLSAVRFSDSPGSSEPSPNGLNGEDVCQLMQYAGMSDKMCGIGIYNYNPSNDINHQTAFLSGEMMWYFIEGFLNRKKDLPEKNSNQFTLYRVHVSQNQHDINFLKSNTTGRWWMELPMQPNKKKLNRHHLLPCSYNDYSNACNNEIPERWWQAIKKLS